MLNLFGRKPALLLRVSIVVEPDGDRFHAYAPALKGLHVDGRTEAEAAQNAHQAVAVYLDSLARHQEPLPVGPDLSIHELQPAVVPEGAFLHSVTIKWPSLQMSGIS